MQNEATLELVFKKIEEQVKRLLTLEEREALRRAYDANMRIIVVEPTSARTPDVRTPTRSEGITAVRTDSVGATT